MTPTAFISTYIDRVIGIIMGVLFIYFTFDLLLGYAKDAARGCRSRWAKRRAKRQTMVEATKGLAAKPLPRLGIRRPR